MEMLAKKVYEGNGGSYYSWSPAELPQGNIGAAKLALDKNGFALPRYSDDPLRPSVLETTVKAVNLFIVPRFFVVSKIADPDGLEWFSIISTPNTIFTHLAGSSSVWKALSPSVLQAAFNVDPEVEQLFRSKRTADAIFFPPPN
ncbi:hypothetical protein D0Y65_032518 [Glycine soja]|uniref:Cupin type-1 domain-containing protein n=1 Tax=Glycine soja TaxID=3848 RepID=A0A445IDM4_GLYSO|nr:hypothetical protein D0Y65_032518 [Glycine soja]